MDDRASLESASVFSFSSPSGIDVTISLRLDPLHSSILHLLKMESQPLISLDIANHKRRSIVLRISVEIERYSERSVDTVTVLGNETKTTGYFPTVIPDRIASINELMAGSLRVTVSELPSENLILDRTLVVHLLAVNSAPLAALDPTTQKYVDQSRYLGTFVTPHDIELDALLYEASRYLDRPYRLAGYRSAVMPQIQALYDALAARGTQYVDSTLDFNPAMAVQATQRIRLPRHVLTTKLANCIDGTLLLASLLERIGIESAIVIIPKHAMLAWVPEPGSDEWVCVETTLIGVNTFDKAVEIGSRRAQAYKDRYLTTGDAAYFRLWPVRDLRADGIYPLPLPGQNDLGRIAQALEALGSQAQVHIQESIDARAPEIGRPPYRGLEHYDVDDGRLFFGRENLTKMLVDHVLTRPFLAVTGASGSGKSSLVRAGLVPALTGGATGGSQGPDEEDSHNWRICIVTPTAHPLRALSTALAKKDDSIGSQLALVDDMLRDSRSLDLMLSRLLSDNPAKRLLLIVDQFEECFVLCRDPVERKAFIDNVLLAANNEGQTSVVITLRADFYAPCAEYENLRSALSQDQRYIGLMTQDELRSAIEKPAQLGNWDFEPGLVDVLLNDIENEPGALPLLSHALLETWNRRRVRTMTFTGYYDIGGVKGAIAETAETVFQDVFDDDERAVAQEVFIQLTQINENAPHTRRRVAKDELTSIRTEPRIVNQVLEILKERRLITFSRVSEVEYVDVAHEALIRNWRRLSDWISEIHESLRLHRQLRSDAKSWQRIYNRGPNGLYQGQQLQRVINFVPISWLVDLERDFITTGSLLEGAVVFADWINKVTGKALSGTTDIVADYVLHQNAPVSKVISATVAEAARTDLLSEDTSLALGTKLWDEFLTTEGSTDRRTAAYVLWALRDQLEPRQAARLLPYVVQAYFYRNQRTLLTAIFTAVTLLAVLLSGFWFHQTQYLGQWALEPRAYGGGIQSAGFPPNAPDTFYAVTTHGNTREDGVALLRGDLQTGEWQTMSENITNMPIEAMAVAKTEEGLQLYLSVRGKGIIRSDDEGKNWEEINQGLRSYVVVDLDINPADANWLIAGSGDQRGIFETRDAGKTWKDISGERLTGVSVTATAFSQVNGGTQFAGTEHGQLLSRTPADNSEWVPRAVIPGTGAITTISAEPSQGETIYAGTNSGTILKSTDGGDTWIRYSSDSAIFSIDSVTVVPAQPEKAFLTGFGIGGYTGWATEDGGGSWNRIESHEYTRDFHRMLAQPDSQEPQLFVYGRAGIFRSTDLGESWQFQYPNAPLTTINQMPSNSPRSATQIFSSGDSVYFSAPSSQDAVWRRSAGPPTLVVTDLYRLADDPETLYLAGHVPNEWSVFQSNDGARTWQRMGQVPGHADKFFHHTTSIAVTQSDTERKIYVGTNGCGLIFSSDSGATWQTSAREECILPNDAPRSIRDVAVMKGSPGHLLVAADHNRIYRSEDNGITWTFVELPIAHELVQIEVDPVQPLIAYAAAGADGFWRSEDGGQSWIEFSGPISGEQIIKILPVPGQSTNVYAIMRSGSLWYSSSGGQKWQHMGVNPELRDVTSLAYDPDNESLLVGTVRSGVHRFKRGVLIRWIERKN